METKRIGSKLVARRFLLALAVMLPPALFIYLLAFSRWPLGVVGEWVWNRSPHPPVEWTRWVFPASSMMLLVIVAGLGAQRRSSRLMLEIAALAILLCSGVLFQSQASQLPIPGWGIERWPAALYYRSTSGYFTVAREIKDLPRFLQNYSTWAEKADNFHLGTHPPGLIAIIRVLLDTLERHPQAVTSIERTIPSAFRMGLDVLPQEESLTESELAALWIMCLMGIASNGATGLGVYLIARLLADRTTAWWGTSFWLAAPANLLFLPLADSYYASLAIGSLTLCLYSQRTSTGLLAILGGVLLGMGLSLSLAFLAVGALCGIALVLESLATQRYARGLLTLLYLAAGIALTICYWFYSFDLNMFDVWGTNLQKHHGFYDVMPRSYGAWAIPNLMDFAWMAGPGLVFVAVLGVLSPMRPWDSMRRLGVAWLTTIAMLELSGRNLGEVARLWLFLTPWASLVAPRWIGSTGLVPLLALIAQSMLTLVSVGWVEPLLPIHGNG